IIPGRVEFPVELRDLEAAKVERIWARIRERFAAIAREENVEIECVPLAADQPARTDPAFQQAIREAAQAAGLATRDLPSGAGHDAQNASRFAPMGMIFVPSRGGISHSPRELTPPEEVANVLEGLYRSVLLLDAGLKRTEGGIAVANYGSPNCFFFFFWCSCSSFSCFSNSSISSSDIM